MKVRLIFRTLLVIFITITLCTGQILNKTNSDSLHNFYWKPDYLLFYPLNNGPAISLQQPLKSRFKKARNWIDMRRVFPKNPLFIDYRESSYYVPGLVRDEIARGMNRPSPNSFLPVLTVAYLAGRLALQYIKIEDKIRIHPSDYILNPMNQSVLMLLFEQYPQTATELYEKLQRKMFCTAQMVRQALMVLMNHKLVKIKHREKASPLYFPAQKRDEAAELIEKGIAQEKIGKIRKKKLLKLLYRLQSAETP